MAAAAAEGTRPEYENRRQPRFASREADGLCFDWYRERRITNLNSNTTVARGEGVWFQNAVNLNALEVILKL